MPDAASAAGSDDVWAVGENWIQHWDGRLWKGWPTPDQTPQGRLNGVAAVARDNAWAVGVQDTSELSWGHA
jgi:hypothetical protein